MSSGSREKARNRAEYVRRELESMGFEVDRPAFLQWLMHELKEPNPIYTDTHTLRAFFPFISNTLMETDGIFLELSRIDKSPVFYDIYIHTNYNLVVLYPRSGYRVDCEGDGTACIILDRVYKRVFVVTYNFTGGYRFDGSPSFSLYLYRGINESYNYVLDTFGDKILVYASITSNTSSYTFYLIKLEAPYRCFELNTPFYLSMFLIKTLLSLLIVGAIFMAYKAWFKS